MDTAWAWVQVRSKEPACHCQVVSLFGHKSSKRSILESNCLENFLSFMGNLSENQLLHLNQAKKVGFLGEQSQAFHLSSDENSYTLGGEGIRGGPPCMRASQAAQ